MPAPAPKTILAIDDEPHILDILTTVLQLHGYNVLTASNGRDGIALYEQRWQDIHAVLLDYMMPEMTGDKVFDRLKLINPDVAVLLVSGSADRSLQAVMLAKGIRAIVHKPFYLDELVRQVSQIASTT